MDDGGQAAHRGAETGEELRFLRRVLIVAGVAVFALLLCAAALVAVLLFSVVVAGVVFGVMGTVLAGPLTVLAYTMVAKLSVRETLGQPAEVPGEDRSG